MKRPPDLLAGPIIPTLIALAGPNVLGLAAQTMTIAYDGYVVSRLGTDALAAVALVFPLSMLMVQLSRAAMGGGVASAVARALGAGSRQRAGDLAWHGLVIEVVLGLLMGLMLYFAGPLIYRALGGRGPILELAQSYALPIFGGAIVTWFYNGLSAVHTGAGNMRLPALCLVGSGLAHLALCPALVFGMGPLPALGIAGASTSYVFLQVVFSGALLAPLVAGRGALTLKPVRLRIEGLMEVFKVGVPASVSPFITNGSVVMLTGYAGSFGTAALAGYGVGARLEYVLIPISFGFGAGLLAMVGRNVGAGQFARAERIIWQGSSLVAALTGGIGLTLALFPDLWTQWFIADATHPAHAVANLYLRIVGVFYAPFGFGLAIFFAAQGASRLAWPLTGSIARVIFSAVGGAVAVSQQSLAALFAVIGCSFVLYAGIPAAALKIARGMPRGN